MLCRDNLYWIKLIVSSACATRIEVEASMMGVLNDTEDSEENAGNLEKMLR
jgi:hypothetical protein